jgi:hypothetical protein
MKTKFSVVFILFFIFNLTSQITNYRWHTYGKFSGGIIDTSNYFNGGLSAEFLLFKKWGLNYNLEFQHRTDKFNHLHGSIGSVGGPVIFGIGLVAGLANSVDGDTTNNSGIGVGGMLLGLVVLIIPDGVSYHIPIGYKWDISPYANFLGFDWIRNRKINYNEFKYACSVGIRGTYLLKDRFTLSCFLESRKSAPTGWGLGGGIGMGYLFKNRENSSN